MTPEDVRDMLEYVRRHRTGDAEFDVVIGGHTTGKEVVNDSAIVERYRAAGATWWLEDLSPWPYGWNWSGPWPLAAMRERIHSGPPRAWT
jgi:hypothetical protein